MLPDKRLKRILRDLQAGGVGTVTSLATEVGVSQATSRRDLKQPADAGRVRRVYGGALPVLGSDDPFAEVAAVRTRKKVAIATRCADLITDGETVLIDIGTTAHRVPKKLRLVLLGGMLRRKYRSPRRLPDPGHHPPAARRPAHPRHQRHPPGRPGHGHHGGRGTGQEGDDRSQRSGDARR